jgi:hypothetical protein
VSGRASSLRPRPGSTRRGRTNSSAPASGDRLDGAGRVSRQGLAVVVPRDVMSTAIARSICASCPVRAECLDDARSSSFLVLGMWGGLTEQERRSGPDE